MLSIQLLYAHKMLENTQGNWQDALTDLLGIIQKYKTHMLYTIKHVGASLKTMETESGKSTC